MYLQSLSSVVGLRQASASALASARVSATNRIALAALPGTQSVPWPGQPDAAGSTPAAIIDEIEFSATAETILETPPPLAGSPTPTSTLFATDQPGTQAERGTTDSLTEPEPKAESQPTKNESSENSSTTESDSELTPEEREQVQKLVERDREVRTHEQAHLAAAGPHARGGPTYTYQKGPDGKRYAIGGEVQIDTSPVAGDPEATIRKAQVVRAAALAPAEPSSQDRAVAAAATKMQQEAQAELSRMRAESPASEQSITPDPSSRFELDVWA